MATIRPTAGSLLPRVRTRARDMGGRTAYMVTDTPL